MKKRLILINPANEVSKGLRLRRQSLQPPLGLAIVAALTPEDWHIRIIDENFSKFRYREADLVGITAFSSNVYRAYQIADEYRQKGIPVVLGGIHATLMPEEAMNHVDVVVTGEAEMVWKDVLRDFGLGQLKRRYDGLLDELGGYPLPRHDLFHPAYIFGAVQTTRGCPMNCDFCSVPVMNGFKYRERPVPEILDELEIIPQKLIYFVDDNMIGYSARSRDHVMELFRGIIDRGIKKEWFAYVSINIADHEEIIKLAAKAGCKMFLIGIESESETQLAESNKKLNIKAGRKKIHSMLRLMHKYGINALGTFIFGFDSDSPDDIRKRVRFMKWSSFDVAQATVLTPFPGTRLFDRWQKEGRILSQNFPFNWQYYQGLDVVYSPAGMSPETLSSLMKNYSIKLYSYPVILFSFLRTFWNTRNWRTAVWALQTNLTYHANSREQKVTVVK